MKNTACAAHLWWVKCWKGNQMRCLKQKTGKIVWWSQYQEPEERCHSIWNGRCWELLPNMIRVQVVFGNEKDGMTDYSGLQKNLLNASTTGKRMFCFRIKGKCNILNIQRKCWSIRQPEASANIILLWKTELTAQDHVEQYKPAPTWDAYLLCKDTGPTGTKSLKIWLPWQIRTRI